jgi:hypothetical protein
MSHNVEYSLSLGFLCGAESDLEEWLFEAEEFLSKDPQANLGLYIPEGSNAEA